MHDGLGIRSTDFGERKSVLWDKQSKLGRAVSERIGNSNSSGPSNPARNGPHSLIMPAAVDRGRAGSIGPWGCGGGVVFMAWGLLGFGNRRGRRSIWPVSGYGRRYMRTRTIRNSILGR